MNCLGMEFLPVEGLDVLFGKYPIRVRDYGAFVAETGRAWKKPDFRQGPDHPAVNVSWEDAKAFCAWLSKREGREYRLSRDWEWSVAVGLKEPREGTPASKSGKIQGVCPWGTCWPPPCWAGNYGWKKPVPERCLAVDRWEHTSPVGSFRPNRFGLYDLGGNVWEWCEDFYDGKDGARVLRGASWLISHSRLMLSSYRRNVVPSFRYGTYGFRVVLGVR